ncbi:hypothetical protein MHU86_14481 [Fragilaria crotonensis]|nr:hypothetical protein MHU86_14481 [Fragilaria crotonensis]
MNRSSPPTFICPKGNPVASGVVVLIIQPVRDTLDTEERRLGCVQHVMFHYAKAKIQWTELFCSVPRSGDIVRPMLCPGTKLKCQSAHGQPTCSTIPSYPDLSAVTAEGPIVPASASRNDNDDDDYIPEIPAVMTMMKAVPSVLQLVVGHAVQ